MSARVLCVGAAHWDVIARASGLLARGDDLPGTVERRPGGVALNVAVGLAGQGVPVTIYAAVGTDAAGDELIACLASLGIDTSALMRAAGATDSYVAVEDSAGEMVAAIAHAALLEEHVGALCRRAAEAAECAALVFVDANLPGIVMSALAEVARAKGVPLIANPVSPAKAYRLVSLLGTTPGPILVTNLAEAAALAGGAYMDAPAAARALVSWGASAALVTDGPRAAALAAPGALVTALPPAVVDGASVTGAGDACAAGYIAALLRGDGPEQSLEAALHAAAQQMGARGCPPRSL